MTTIQAGLAVPRYLGAAARRYMYQRRASGALRGWGREMGKQK